MGDLLDLRNNRLELELQKEVLTSSFYEFYKWAFNVLEPAVTIRENFYSKYICQVLQEEVFHVKAGLPKNKDLIINQPPRTSKSIITSIVFNAWAWIHMPSARFMCISLDDGLALDNASKLRRLIQSDSFQELFGDLYKINPSVDSKELFEVISKGGVVGSRLSKSMRSNITGFSADFILIDDPENKDTVASKPDTDRIRSQWSNAIFSRLTPPSKGCRILIQQHLGVEDLTSFLLSINPDNYRHICLPAKLTPVTEGLVKPVELLDGYQDGLLDPELLSEKVLQMFSDTMDDISYSGQFLQNPIAGSGNIFKREWFKIVNYVDVPKEVWEEAPMFTIDTSYGVKNGDYSAMMAYVMYNNQMWVKEIKRGRYAFPELTKAIIKFVHDNGYSSQNSLIRVEPKASGISTVDQLISSTMLNIIKGEVPKESKEARAKSCQMTLQTGRVNLIEGDWNNTFLAEAVSFPMGANDDQVDVLVDGIRASFHQSTQPVVFINLDMF